MNSPKVVVSLGIILTCSVLLTACGGGGSKTTPPAGPPTITTATLTSGVVNAPYQNPNGSSVSLFATGGTGAYTWSIPSGKLPPGLSLNASTGVISGTPTAVQAGGYPFTAEVTDAALMTATANLSIYIEGVVSITPAVLPSGSVGMAYKQTLTASGGLPPYKWALAANSGPLPDGLTLDSNAGVISGMPTMNGGPAPFTVQVTDSETSPGLPAVGDSMFTITIMSITTTQLPQGEAEVPYSATLTAAGGVPFKSGQYSWCITSGSLPDGLTLNNNCTNQPGAGLISGAPTKIGNFPPFTVQVSDNEKSPATATATLSISVVAAVTNANLNGNYVFTFSGYNSGTPVVMAGSFVADGNGKITSGVLDYNDGGGESPINDPTPQTIVPGSGSVYSINPNGLGTMTITTNSSVFNLQVAIRSDGSGSLIQSDPASPKAYGSGAIMSNTPLSTGEQFPLCGSPVALGFSGFDNTLITRYAGAGEFQFDPTTCVDAENGVLDTDDGGSPSSPTFKGTFNELVDNTSRGITRLTLTPGGAHTYAFYLVSSSDRKTNQLFWVATEPASQPAALTLWSALQQAKPATGWNNSNLAGGAAVAELNALDTTPAADVTAGLFQGTNASGDNCQNNGYDMATFSYDENQGGTCNGGTCGSKPQSSQGMYCVDKTTGRVTLTHFNAGPFATPPVFYLVKTNQGFVVGTDLAVTSGSFQPQTGSPFSPQSLFGLYSGGTISPALSLVTNAVTSLFADGVQNINGQQDTSGHNGPSGPNNFAYTYTLDNTGRVVVQQNGTTVAIMYVIAAAGSQTSPAAFVMLPATDPNPALSIFGTTVIP